MTQAQIINVLGSMVAILLFTNAFQVATMCLLLLRRIDTEQVRRLLAKVTRRDNSRLS